MNKHVCKVIKWLENPKSVSQEEREENAMKSDYTAYYAAAAADENDTEKASFWTDRYFNRTGENKQDYLNAIEAEK